MTSTQKKCLFTLFFSLIFLNFFSVNAQQSERVTVVIKDEVVVSLKSMEDQGLKEKWTKVNRTDPSSKTKHFYSGYLLNDLLAHIKIKYNIKNIDHIETMAKDGYKLIIDKESLENKQAFIALAVSNVPKQGLYNYSLKSYFRWEPSYILLGHKANGASVASPYQVVKMTIYQSEDKKLLLDKVHSSYRKGATTFMKTCSKCHSYKNHGGNKAPKIDLVMRRWKRKKDSHLSEFLRDPQGVSKRKIQMSPFKGTDEELNELIKFLRSFSSKTKV